MQTYEELNKKFTQAISWLDELGIRVRHSRFEKIQKDIRNFINSAKTTNTVRFSNEDDYVSGIYSLIEARDFVNIYEVYRNKIGDKLLRTLSIAVKGRHAGNIETSSNNKARNALAELSWGALLEKHNYSTTHEFRPDILQYIDTKHQKSIIWEVKRPLSIKNFVKCLKDGSSQIKKAFQGNVNIGQAKPIGGCIVVFVENLLGPYKSFIVGSDYTKMDLLVQKELKNWWSKNRPSHKTYRKPGVLGVVLWWRLLGKNIKDSTNNNLIDWNQRLFNQFTNDNNKLEIEYLTNIIYTLSM